MFNRKNDEIWIYQTTGDNAWRLSCGPGENNVIRTGTYADLSNFGRQLARDLKWPFRLVPMNVGWQREGVSITLAPPGSPSGCYQPKRPRR